MKRRDTKRVYSTETNGPCLGCRRTLAKCVCVNASAVPQSDGVVRLHRETKGRKGKGVTLVKGLPPQELSILAKKLKSACGVGGAVKSDVIELQSADREHIKKLLEKEGYSVKISGG